MPATELLRPFAARLVLYDAPVAGGACPVGLRGTDCLIGCADAATLARLRKDGVELAPARKPFAGDVETALVSGVSLMLQQRLFAVTKAGWRVAATRPGYVAATQTHLDVTLDLDDVRIAERLQGLDLSPGWVPWLGRVVTLHFEPFIKPPRLQ
jgi:hypothetical protein